jgi:hypothetical protein
VDVLQNGTASNHVAYTTIPPVLSSISPTAVSPGMQMTFTGTGFGAAQWNGRVYFGNGVFGTVVSWSDTQVVATVPSGIASGNVKVFQSGAPSNGIAFTIH